MIHCIMHTQEKSAVVSPLFRVGGALIGAMLGAIGGAIIVFIAAVLDVFGGGFGFASSVEKFTIAGGCIGLVYPRLALQALWFFFPEIFEKA